MSFRELRSFTETMKLLGYPRLISMENFRTPNFELVADCLYWLVHRYYPGVEISDEISTEGDRVKFLQSVAQVMLTKARMKLNIKRLYAADGAAVKELLKIAALLYQATVKATDDDEDPSEAADLGGGVLKGFSAKEVKQHAAEILRAGGVLYDALGMEAELREARARAVAGHVDTDFVERSVQEAIAQVEDGIRSMEGQLEELERNERTLDSKIDKKKQELERNEKRLSTLQNVRPQYMDEYERLQGELNVLYTQYLDRFRNLEYIEAELEAYYQAEQDKMDAQDRRLKKMQKRLAAQELRILRGEEQVDEAALNDLGADDSDEEEEEEAEEGDDDLSDLAGGQDDQRLGRGGRGGSSSGNAGLLGKQTLRRGNSSKDAGGRRGGGADLGNGRVVGQLEGFDDEDEASIDEDENSDGGEVSMAGSDRERDSAAAAAGPGGREGSMMGAGAPNGGVGYGGGGYGGADYGGAALDDEEAELIADDEDDNDF